jgi:hypothetical protein
MMPLIVYGGLGVVLGFMRTHPFLSSLDPVYSIVTCTIDFMTHDFSLLYLLIYRLFSHYLVLDLLELKRASLTTN